MSGQIELSDVSLETMLRRRAGRTRPVDLPAELFRALDAAPEPRRPRLSRPRLPALPMPWPVGRGVAPVLVAAGLLLALLAGTLVGAQLLRERTPIADPPVRWSTAPDRWVLDPVPGTPASVGSIAAVSADEAWATDGAGLWHFVDGSWAGPFTRGLPARPFMADYDARPRMGAIAVAPDGTVWAILDAGLGRFRDGTWDLVVADKLVSLAIAPDGTVWAGTSGGGYVRRLDARTGEARPIFCGWPSSITAAADGSLFIDGTNWGIGHQLWVIRNDSCDRLDPPWVGTNVFVGGLQADPSGGVVMILREPYGPPYNERLVRFEDGRWSVVQAKVPGGDGFPHAVAAVDPAGGAWRVEGDPARIERFDGTQWVEVVPPQGMISRELAMARDGTVWFAGGPGIERLRPAWDDPSAAPTP